MAIKRLKYPACYSKAYYHCGSRTAGRVILFHEGEKEKFIELVYEYAHFCGINIVNVVVMGNHYHIVFEMPQKGDLLPDDQVFLDRLAALSTKQAKKDAQALIQYRKEGDHHSAEALRQKLFSRMGDVSKFMKLLLERFTQWFNRKTGRKGTLWEGPYHCEVVEGMGQALLNECAYSDLNPVRANLDPDPAKYRWSGYGRACAGDALALKGLAIAVGIFLQEDPANLSREKILQTYNLILHIKGEIKGYDQQGNPLRLGFTREECLKVFAEGGKLPIQAYLRLKVRYMTCGLAMGSRKFIEEVFAANRHLFGRRRKTGARKMRGLAEEDLYTLRDLRKNVLS